MKLLMFIYCDTADVDRTKLEVLYALVVLRRIIFALQLFFAALNRGKLDCLVECLY
jgi:hypothetical protein